MLPARFLHQRGRSILLLVRFPYEPACSVSAYRFALYVNQESIVTDVATNDGYWHHVVITWSSARGSWKIYVDGLLNDSGFDLSTGKPIPGQCDLL